MFGGGGDTNFVGFQSVSGTYTVIKLQNFRLEISAPLFYEYVLAGNLKNLA